jgi:large subunit ribosomal protein L21
MYAILDIAGKQFKVSKGDKITTATLDTKPGGKIIFDKVLATDDGKKTTVGKPFIKNTTVTAKVLDHGRTKKILVYKKKRRKGYEKKNTHRQGFSVLEIGNITTKKPAPKKETAKAKTKSNTANSSEKKAPVKTKAKVKKEK